MKIRILGYENKELNTHMDFTFKEFFFFFCLAAKIFVSTSVEPARCFLLQMPSHHDDFAAKDPSN